MKKRLFATVLTLVMLLTTLSPIPAYAADDTTEQLAADLTGDTYTDTTAEADSAYEYTITGTDGSVQTLTVNAQGETGNSIKEATVYEYKKVNSISGSEPYLLVTGTTAITGELGTKTVTITNDTITGDYAPLEWTISGSGDVQVVNNTDKYLTIASNSASTSAKPANVTVSVQNGTVTFSKSIRNIIYTTKYYLTLDDGSVTSQTGSGTAFTLYQKGAAISGYTIDTTGLNELIAQYEAENLVSSNYSTASWNNFQKAMAAAKALQNPAEGYTTLEAANAKLAEVDAAQAALIAAYEALEEVEIVFPTMSWTRTKDDTTNTVYNIPFCNTTGATTANGVTYDRYEALTWNWSTLEKLVNDQEVKQQEVWNYTHNSAISAADIQTGGTSWESASVHKISGTFTWPEGYDLDETTITLQSKNDKFYQDIYDRIEKNDLSNLFPNGKVFPVDDDVYVVMWAGDDKPTVDNINDYLLFWTGTSGKGIWSKKGNSDTDWARTTPATFLSASKQGVRAFSNAWPNAVGVTDGLKNSNVTNMRSYLDSVKDYLDQSNGWYTLTDTTAVNSVMRNNYPDGIAAGTQVHLDLYLFNNDGGGGIDELEIILAKKPETETDVTVNYYYGSVTNPSDTNAFLGSATLTNQAFGTEITLSDGTNAGQLNYMWAAAVAKAGDKTVNNGAQQGSVPYVVVEGKDNVINVLYLPDANDITYYVYDFGVTNTYSNVLSDSEKNYTVTLKNSDGVTFDKNTNTISYTPSDASVTSTMATLQLTSGSTTINKLIYFMAASNVLYEETFFTGSVWTLSGAAANAAVTDNGSTVYGYTDSYKNTTGANGAYTAAVSADTKNTGDLVFNFSGTGFDLMGTCGPATGTLMVRVNDASGNYVKAFVVDTAFNDSNYGTLYQVPLIHEQGLANGAYQLVIRGAYIDYSASASSASTMSMRGGVSSAINDLYDLMYGMGLTDEQIDSVEFISVDTNGAATYAAESGTPAAAAAPAEMTLGVDSIRVYQPADNTAYAANEQNVVYTNVLDAVTNDSFIAYVEGDADNNWNVGNYEANGGPQNEIYLPGNAAIALKFGNADPIQVSLRNVSGTADAAIMGTNKTIAHSTEMYYEVTPSADGYVTIKNTGNGLLAVCNLKFPATATVEYLGEEDYPVIYAMLRGESQEPEQPTEPECGGTVCQYEQVAAKAATCVAGGNVEYWYCAEHDLYYVQGENGLTAVEAAEVLTNPNPFNHVGETELRNESETYTGDLHCAACGAMLQKGEVIEPEVPEVPEDEVFKPAKFSAKTSVMSFFGRKIVTLTVTASSDVDYITVNGQKVTSRSFFWGSSKTFVLTNVYASHAAVNLEIVAYNSDGVASEALSVKR